MVEEGWLIYQSGIDERRAAIVIVKCGVLKQFVQELAALGGREFGCVEAFSRLRGGLGVEVWKPPIVAKPVQKGQHLDSGSVDYAVAA
ncbi:MAG: hypothetical protein ACPL7K_09240, partial [Armatimonadota bacterium]